jgi:hypothetical protein
VGIEVISVTHQPERSWLNAVAPKNISTMAGMAEPSTTVSMTALVSQLPMCWSNAVAFENMFAMVVTALVSQPPMSG